MRRNVGSGGVLLQLEAIPVRDWGFGQTGRLLVGMRGKGKMGFTSSFGGMSETVLYHRPKTVI